MSFLSGKSSDAIERDVAALLKFDDPPVWSVGTFRGVASKIDAFFAVHADVTWKDLDEFFLAAMLAAVKIARLSLFKALSQFSM